MTTATADQVDLTAKNDYGLTAAIVRATASLARCALGGDRSTDEHWSAALDGLRASRSVIDRARGIEAKHCDALRQALMFLHDHGRAAAIVLRRGDDAVAKDDRDRRGAEAVAQQARRLAELAGDVAGALAALKVI
jgi:hypothetical protein